MCADCEVDDLLIAKLDAGAPLSAVERAILIERLMTLKDTRAEASGEGL